MKYFAGFPQKKKKKKYFAGTTNILAYQGFMMFNLFITNGYCE
jgi:hypothetical protein